MNIVDVNYKIKCDMPNCKNHASIKIEKTGFIKSAGMFLCKGCMNELYVELGTKIVPKSIDNMLNKRIRGEANAKKKQSV